MMIASSITGFGKASFLPPDVPEAIIQVLPLESQPKKDISKIKKSITVEEYVRNYFSDIPIMIEIARCESRFRQYDANGKAIRGEQNKSDRGVMQINEYYHNKSSVRFGYNIFTLKGNTSYARVLFEKYGVKPWKSSISCWGNTTAYSKYKSLATK